MGCGDSFITVIFAPHADSNRSPPGTAVAMSGQRCSQRISLLPVSPVPRPTSPQRRVRGHGEALRLQAGDVSLDAWRQAVCDVQQGSASRPARQRVSCDAGFTASTIADAAPRASDLFARQSATARARARHREPRAGRQQALGRPQQER